MSVWVEWLDKSRIKLSQLSTKLKLKLKLRLAKDGSGLVVGSKVGHIQNPLSRYLPTYLLVSCIMYKFCEMNM